VKCVDENKKEKQHGTQERGANSLGLPTPTQLLPQMLAYVAVLVHFAAHKQYTKPDTQLNTAAMTSNATRKRGAFVDTCYL